MVINMKEEILILNNEDPLNYRFGFRTVAFGLASLIKDHYRSFFNLLQNVFKNYLAKQYERKPAFYVDEKLDGDILAQSGTLGAYFDFFPFLIGSAGFVKKYIKKAEPEDLDFFLRRLADFYSDAGFIFENAPTTLLNRKATGWPMKILHFLDRPRNFFPSLHVVITSYVYFETSKLIDKYHSDQLDGSRIKKCLFKRALRIIEACLLTKQHGLRDIAGGLALVSIREPEFQETAHKIIQSMFVEKPFVLPGDFSGLLRQEIERIYAEIMDYTTVNLVADNHSQSMAEYIKTRVSLKQV